MNAVIVTAISFMIFFLAVLSVAILLFNRRRCIPPPPSPSTLAEDEDNGDSDAPKNDQICHTVYSQPPVLNQAVNKFDFIADLKNEHPKNS